MGVGFNLFDEEKKGVGIEGSSELPYVLILVKLWHGYWKTQLKIINKKLDEDNEKLLGIWNGRYRNVCRFSRNAFLNNIGCLVSDPNFGLAGSMM